MDNDVKAPRGILIVGGYGHVGRRIAAELMDVGYSLIRIGGRNAQKAKIAATQLRCEPTHIDLDRRDTWEAALAGVRTVIVCIDQQELGFPAYVLERGLIYLDVTASDGFFRQVEALGDLALEKGGSAVLSVGLAPGLTNLLVKACATQMDEAQTARIGVMLGLGDAHGPAAFEWTMEQFVLSSARRVPMENISFGTPSRPSPAMPLNFADQHVVRRTLGLHEARTLLAFDPPWQSRAMLGLLRFIASRPRLVQLAKRLMPYLTFGSNRAALAIEVHGRRNGADVVMRATLDGRREADITALVAVLVADHVLRAGIAPGVRHIEQLISIEDLAPALSAHGVVIHLPSAPAKLPQIG